jgi:hypothetical protein
MALCGQVVDFIGLDVLYDTDKRTGVGHIGIMQVDEPSLFHIADPLIKVEVLYPAGIEGG